MIGKADNLTKKILRYLVLILLVLHVRSNAFATNHSELK